MTKKNKIGLERPLNMLRKYSNWKIILPSSILFVLFTLIIFPFYLMQINEIANENVLFLDGRLNYNFEQVNTLFNKMGREGRDIYLFMAGRVDMVYPLVYSLFFVLLLASLLKKTFSKESNIIFLSLLPLVGMLFDYLENLNTLKLLNKFPNITPEQVDYGSQMTQLKWVFLIMSILLVLALGITITVQKLLEKASTQQKI